MSIFASSLFRDEDSLLMSVSIDVSINPCASCLVKTALHPFLFEVIQASVLDDCSKEGLDVQYILAVLGKQQLVQALRNHFLCHDCILDITVRNINIAFLLIVQ